MVRHLGISGILLCVFPWTTTSSLNSLHSQSRTTPTTINTRTGVECTKVGGFFSAVVRLCICEPCHVCEFKKNSLTCGYKEHKELDASDGSDLTVDQPLLAPTDWFLTEEEVTASRNGSTRGDMATYTTGNDVTTYTVPKEFFDAAFTDLSSTKEGDRVMLAGWGTDLIPFQPDVDGGNQSQLHDVVEGIIQRGGSFHALIWANMLGKSQNIKVRDDINDIAASVTTGKKPLFLFDDRVRTISSTHHQKNLIIASTNSTEVDQHPVAYVGGIDITSGRWDTIYHNESELRESTGVSGSFKGWIDGHVRIHGPAAKDVAGNFLSRWNSDYEPTQGLAKDLLDFDNPPYDDLAPLDYTSSRTKSELGSQNVQIVRTFSCKYEHYDEFAPYGENSLFQARIKALLSAKNFICIEDQYFILVPELLEAILQVMPTIQRLIVVVQRPVGRSKFSGYEKYMFEMTAPIQKLYPNKIQIYTTKEELDLYIHSKVVIIDDVYLSVGSANWNRRSMTSDSELAANIIDDETVESPDGITVLKAARDFRIRKFQEMTGLSYEELDAMPFIEAANQFDVVVADNSSFIEAYEVKKRTYFTAVTDAVRKRVDPQDTCT
ncbi:phospholipase D, Pi-sPLD-like-12 [Phytophthora infestans T30-4]|uniref:phospholipase D n=1 Tax=Phytophthora infestans (strain T30-4) TaxID=403677 RepID=D0NL74_PHYIT|nr:phospholipase D, Pi-sPLD-like-12 [Phytophthora infestans T30-4]EEY60392.1 phospholipase D, Pi-sPLD-like-12 [Phytophthora infestans T30-4]|eukprot:XP_002900188.1 phospholipase D, Pi-sPLD-like-12 [Phytophthora infestans T30-4]